VVLRPRRGFMVASISRGEIVDIFESRALLESRAGYLATQVRDSEDVAETKRLLELSSHALLSSEPAFQRFYELNVEFHDRLLRPLRRPHLKRLVQRGGTVYPNERQPQRGSCTVRRGAPANL
jgi:DNA-binding GntR family transcriptional regulator